MSDAVKLNGSDLNLDDFVRVVRDNHQVEIASEGLIRIQNGRKRGLK